MTAIGIDTPGYRDAHNKVDARLIYTQGILFALGQMITLHPALSGNDM